MATQTDQLALPKVKDEPRIFFLGRKGEVRTILSSPLNKENKTKTTTQQKTPQTTSFFPPGKQLACISKSGIYSSVDPP